MFLRPYADDDFGALFAIRSRPDVARYYLYWEAQNRNRGPSEALRLARLATSRTVAGVVGFGLDGDEAAHPPAPFVDAFAVATDAGLLAVPHAGELSGPATVADALNVLHSDRNHARRASGRGPSCSCSGHSDRVAGSLLEAGRLRQVGGKPEGTSLGVSTDTPLISRVDDLTAQLADPSQRRVHVRNREIRERHPIAGARSPGVEAERGASPVGLPAFTLALDAVLKLHFQEPAPENASPGRVVGGEFHKSKKRGHALTIAAPDSTRDCPRFG